MTKTTGTKTSQEIKNHNYWALDNIPLSRQVSCTECGAIVDKHWHEREGWEIERITEQCGPCYFKLQRGQV